MTSEIPKIVPQWTARQVVIATLFVAVVGVAFWLVYRFHSVLLLLFAAIVLGTALRPLVRWLAARGMPRGAGIALIFVSLFAALVIMLVLLAPLVVRQGLQLAGSLPGMYVDFRSFLLTSNSLLLQNIGLNLPPDLGRLENAPAALDQPIDAVARFLAATGTVLTGLAVLLAVLVLTAYWIIESERAVRTLLLLFPAPKREQLRELIEAIETRVGAYLRGQVILSLAIGLLALVAYLIIGLPNAVALAIIAGIFEAVPIFGPTLGAIPAGLVAFSLNPTLVIWVIVATFVIQNLENYLLVPRVMDASVGVNPIVVLLSLVTFTSLFGFAGALLAIPLASVLQLLLERLVFTANPSAAVTTDRRDRESALRYEIQVLIADIRKQLRRKEERSDQSTDRVEDDIEALAVELESFLTRPDQE